MLKKYDWVVLKVRPITIQAFLSFSFCEGASSFRMFSGEIFLTAVWNIGRHVKLAKPEKLLAKPQRHRV